MRFIHSLVARLIHSISLCIIAYRKSYILSYATNHLKNCGDDLTLSSDSQLLGLENISIGQRFRAGSHFRLETHSVYLHYHYQPDIIIGDNVSFEDFCHVSCIDKVVIGSGCMFASRVFITDHHHGFIDNRDVDVLPVNRPLQSRPVQIGCNVWVGEGAAILPGVVLGDNVIVGANSVVTHSFPSNSVIAGNPAQLLRTL